MKVRIKQSKSYYWYADKIGQEFEVENDEFLNECFEIKEGDFKGRGIGKDDCEIITDPIKIPFTFDAWDKDRNQPVWTRDGREVKQLTWFEDSDYTFAGVINNELEAFTKEGRAIIGGKESLKDLFLEHHEREYWVNVYRAGSEISLGMVFTDEEQAKKKIESAGE